MLPWEDGQDGNSVSRKCGAEAEAGMRLSAGKFSRISRSPEEVTG